MSDSVEHTGTRQMFEMEHSVTSVSSTSVSVADKPAAPGAGGTQVGLAGIGIRDLPREGNGGAGRTYHLFSSFHFKNISFLATRTHYLASYGARGWHLPGSKAGEDLLLSRPVATSRHPRRQV